jgi:hypothetical protein
MVKINVMDSGIAAKLIPLQSVRSQPMFMSPEKTDTWLKNLRARSDSELAGQISSGTLVVKF